MLEISFNEGQLDAIERIKRFLSPLNQSKICILSGYAGTGKTTVISHITHSRQFAGKRTILTATTNKAVAVLQSVSNKYAQNIRYATIHKLLKIKRVIDINGYESYIMNVDDVPDRVNKKSIHYYDLIIVDEASMVSKDLYNNILDVSKKIKGKFIFLGDPYQLPPVNEKLSKVFNYPTIYKMELKKVERVKNNILLLSMRIRKSIETNNKIKFKDLICDDITYFRDFKKFIGNYVEKLKQEQKECIILAYTNNRCGYINDHVRRIIFGNDVGKFSPNELIIFNNFYKGLNKNFYTSQQETIKEVNDGVKVFPSFNFDSLLNLRTSMYMENVIDKVAPVKEDTDIREDRECPICFSEEIDTMRETVCGHKFCSTCIKLWLDNNKTCPLCRMEFNLEEGSASLKDLPEVNKTIDYLKEKISTMRYKTYNLTLAKKFVKEEEEETVVCLHETEKKAYEEDIFAIKNILRDIGKDIRKNDRFAGVILSRLWEYIYLNFIDTFADISYGYCITTHKSQGSTYKNVFIDVKNILEYNTKENENLKCFYTGVTRSSGYLSLLN